MKISEFAVNRPVTTTMVVLSMLVLGLLSLGRIPLIFLPDINRPFLRVQASYPGSNPEEVERLVTRPIEEAMGTVPGVRSLNSSSSAEGASVSVEFEEGRDMDIASMEVRERLDRVQPRLPRDMPDPPRVFRWQTTDWPILNFGVAWRGDPDQFENFVENVLEKRLTALEGVANVGIGGLKRKSIYIDLDQELVRAAGVNTRDLAGLVSGGNVNYPAGYVETGGKKYSLRVIGQFQDVREIAELPINSRGLRLEQVADVRFDFPDRIRWIQRLNGRDAVSIWINKASNANIIEVSERVKRTLTEIQQDPRYGEIDYQIFWDQSQEIISSITSLRNAGLIGGGLAVLVLLFFLGNLRNTLVIALAIPISIVFTLFLMYILRLEPFKSDLTLNIISMMGMIYAIGIVVDPSIVVLENIFRVRNEQRLGAVEAALAGSSEVGMAVVASILTNVIVFAPLVFLGNQGMMRFMNDFGVTFCAVSIASLLVALTVVPLLCARIIHKLEPGKERSFPQTRRFFVFLVTKALHHRALTLLSVAGILWGVFLLYKLIDKQGEPWSPERRMFVEARISHNYSMEQATRVIDKVEADLLARKAELDINAVNISLQMGRRNEAEVQVYFNDLEDGGRSTQELQAEIKKLLPVLPGFEWQDDFHGGGHGGGGDNIEVVFKGESMEQLGGYARQLEQMVQGLPGVEDVDLSTELGEEEVRVYVDRDRAAASGVSAEQVARTISSQLSSRPLSRYKAPNREINIQMGLGAEDRVDREGLGTMELTGLAGQRSDLNNVARIESGRGPRDIDKDDRMYNVSVHLKSAGQGIFQLGQQVSRLAATIPLAPGDTWELGRRFRSMVEAEGQSQFAIILSLVLIYILLAALFESFIHPLAIMLSVPFALVGVMLIFLATKTNLSPISYIGVLIVCGVVVNNAIILVDYINLLRSRGLARREAIIEAVQKRLRPILMTASTTVLALLPMTAPLMFPGLFGPVEGRAAMWGPVGLAILGGMITSTFLTLVITPTLYSLLDELSVGSRALFRRVFAAPKPAAAERKGA